MRIDCCLPVRVSFGDAEYAVGIDVESYFDLWLAAAHRRNAVEHKAANGTVVASHRAFALEDVDFHRWLIISGCREGLRSAFGDSRVGLYEFRHNAAHRLDTERKWGNVEQKHVFHLASEYAALDSSADSYDLIGVYAAVWLAFEEVFYDLLDAWNTSRTTHEDNLVDIVGRVACIFHCFAARREGTLNERVGDLLEFGAAKLTHQVFGA